MEIFQHQVALVVYKDTSSEGGISTHNTRRMSIDSLASTTNVAIRYSSNQADIFGGNLRTAADVSTTTDGHIAIASDTVI